MSTRWHKSPPASPQLGLPIRRRTTAPTDTSLAGFASIGGLANAATTVFKAAARDAKRRGVLLAVTVRKEVLDYLRQQAPGGATADEIAAAIKRSPFTVRPRCTELAKMHQIRDAGIRRPNVASGHNAIVWVTRTQLP